MIELKSVTKIYNTNGNAAIGLNDISINLPDTGFICIVGPSGSGKTTLLNIVSCIDSYEEGEMLIDGVKTSSMSSDELERYRRNNVGFVFQNYNLIDSYTVLQNVMLPLEINGMNYKEAKEKALELISKVGLKARAYNKSTKLSGGEKQRCVIARALASGAKIIACDEPTGNLDSKTSKEIIDILKDLATDHLVLMVTHNIDNIETYATRVIRISDGVIASDKILSNPIGVAQDTKTIEKVRFGVLLKTALKNVFLTPKRTILASLILVVLFSFMSIGFIMAIDGKDDMYYETYLTGGYNTSFKARNIISNREGDLNNIQTNGDIYYNDFFYDNYISFEDNDYMSGNFTYGSFKGKHYGSKDVSQRQIFLALSKYDYTEKYAKSLIGKKISSRTYGTFEVVGTALVLEEDTLVYFSNDIRTELTILAFEMGIGIDEVGFSSNINDYNFRIVNEVDYDGYDIVLNEVCKGANVKIYAGAQEIDTTDFNIHYAVRSGMGFQNIPYNNQVYITVQGMMKILDSYNLRASIFYSSDKLCNQEYKLLSQNYDVLNILGYYDLQLGFSDLIFYIITCIVIGVVTFILVLIAYAILSIIMKSKNKDYNVLRTIGLLKNDLKKVSILELEITTSLSLVLVFIILFIFNMTIPDILGMHLLFGNPLAIISVILASLGITYYLGLKFNRKIFKLTIGQSLKAGDFLD